MRLPFRSAGETDAGAFVDVDVRMAKPPLDENRNRRVAERFIVQVGDVRGGIIFGGVELLPVNLRLPPWTFVDVDFEVDAFWLDGAVDQRAGAVVGTARHGKLQRHIIAL